jgi:hypothetical protein
MRSVLTLTRPSAQFDGTDGHFGFLNGALSPCKREKDFYEIARKCGSMP